MPHIYLYGHTNPRVTDELDDLIRVFCVLEKRPEPDHREGVQTLLGKAEAEPGRWRNEGIGTLRADGWLRGRAGP